MKGYFRDPVTTAAVLTEEGFLRTGDQGSIDAHGFLSITGRVKDQFKTDKAKFVAPAPIELKLSSNTDIDQVCVVGTSLPQPIALVTLSATGKEKPQAQVEADMRQTIEAVNSALEKHEHIQTAIILNESWTIENGLLTPSMKIKRNSVEKRYEGNYKQWMTNNGTVVWA